MTGHPFSLIDALSGTLLVALAWGVLAASTIPALRSIDGALESARYHGELIRLDTLLIESCGRVDQPPALIQPAVRTTKDGIRIDYLDGKPGHALHVEQTADGISLRLGDEQHWFRRLGMMSIEVRREPFAYLRVEIVRPRERVARAGRSNRSEDSLVLVAPFGGFPPP